MATKDTQEGVVENKKDMAEKLPALGNKADLKMQEEGSVKGQTAVKCAGSQTIPQSSSFVKKEQDGQKQMGTDKEKRVPGKSPKDESLMQVLKAAFGYSAFREGQEQAIRAILEGNDAFVIMPTGGGKSLTYLLPGLLLPGLVIIVSPLLALMDDQVRRLQERHLPAVAFNSLLSSSQRETILRELPLSSFPPYPNIASSPSSPSQSSSSSAGAPHSPVSYLSSTLSRKYKFLFVTPEQVSTPTFQRVLGQLEARRRGVGKRDETKENRANAEVKDRNQSQGVALVAVDEAHCISTWGHDFRRSYRNLSVLRTILPETPFLACTATATPAVCADIQTNLALRNAVRIGLSFDRKNIFYEVRVKRRIGPRSADAEYDDETPLDDAATAADEEEEWTLENMAAEVSTRHRGECGIIYCFKKATCDSVATALRCKGIPAQAYHAGLSDKVRCELQREWMTGKILVLVATVAFGLGVDNPNVRFVFHHSLPKTMEGYYQESGRCGRDGRPAHALLYYSPRNFESLRYIMDYTFSQLKLYSKGRRAANARSKNGSRTRQGGSANEDESDAPAESVDDQKARLEHMERRYRKELASLKEVRKYCEETICRRACILNFFGETTLPPRRASGTCPAGRLGSSCEANRGAETKRSREETEGQKETPYSGGVKRERKEDSQRVSSEGDAGNPSSICLSSDDSTGVSPSERTPSACMNRVKAQEAEVEVEGNKHSDEKEDASDVSSVPVSGISIAPYGQCCELCEQREAAKANGTSSLGNGNSATASTASTSRLLPSLASRGCTRVLAAPRRPAWSFPGGGMAAVVGEDEGGALARGTLEFETNDCSDDESRDRSEYYGSKGNFRGAAHLRRTAPTSSWCTGKSAVATGPGGAPGSGKTTGLFRKGSGACVQGKGRVVYHMSAETSTARHAEVRKLKGHSLPSSGSKSERVSAAIRAKGILAVMEELERQEQLAEEVEEGQKSQSFFRQRFSATKRPVSKADTSCSSFSSPVPFQRPRLASIASTSGERSGGLGRTACSSDVARTGQPARSQAFVRASALSRDVSQSNAGKVTPQLRSGLYRPRGKG